MKSQLQYPRSIGQVVRCMLLFLLGINTVSQVHARVVRVEITQRADWLGGRSMGKSGAYELLQGRVYYAIDPGHQANTAITDVTLVPRNAAGLVEFAGDFLLLRPKDPAKSRGTVLVEIPNRGRTQMQGSFFRLPPGQRLSLLTPSAVTDLTDAFLFNQGFTVAWVGWQFDVSEKAGLRLSVPSADVSGLVRASYIAEPNRVEHAFSLNGNDDNASGYCAADTVHAGTELTVRTRLDGPPTVIPRGAWTFARQDSDRVVPDRCFVRLAQPLEPGKLYEVVYQAKGSPVAGLGFAAVRDFVAYLKHGGPGDSVLRAHPETLRTVIGYGYSQSARFLRNFLYDGFNADESGHPVFDGLFVAAAGAGRGNFNHRFAVPGVAGNSVLSILEPVDLFPFTDLPEKDPATGDRDGLLVRAKRQRALPKIFYTYTSSEYWARVGSLAHTSLDGTRDRKLPPSARLYFIAGTPHAGPARLTRNDPFNPNPEGQFAHLANVGYWQRFALRALLLDLDEWVRRDVSPPPSAYPTRRAGQLVNRSDVHFPKLPGVEFPTYMPQNWRMDFGPNFRRTGVATKARPALGAQYSVLLPQVDSIGNEYSGIQLPHITVPLATYTAWNYTVPRFEALGYLSGLNGSLLPFPRTVEERTATGDPRLAITERYGSREQYLIRVQAATESLIKQRFMRSEDIAQLLQLSSQLWDELMAPPGTLPQR